MPACHARSGGGDNFKRGDIEMASLLPTRAFDVHMGTDGQNFDCITCHSPTDIGSLAAAWIYSPRITRRSGSLRELPHGHPHAEDDARLSTAMAGRSTVQRATSRASPKCRDRHVSRLVAASVITDARFYEPWIQFATNDVPEYKWWNGTSTFYEFGTPAVPAANGRVGMAMPNGYINDVPSRIYPMKHHLGNQPVDPVTRCPCCRSSQASFSRPAM